MGEWGIHKAQQRQLSLVSVHFDLNAETIMIYTIYRRSVNGVHGPQPDGGDREECIAALNIRFYNDGARLHDIGCDHRKPVVCE